MIAMLLVLNTQIIDADPSESVSFSGFSILLNYLLICIFSDLEYLPQMLVRVTIYPIAMALNAYYRLQKEGELSNLALTIFAYGLIIVTFEIATNRNYRQKEELFMRAKISA